MAWPVAHCPLLLLAGRKVEGQVLRVRLGRGSERNGFDQNGRRASASATDMEMGQNIDHWPRDYPREYRRDLAREQPLPSRSMMSPREAMGTRDLPWSPRSLHPGSDLRGSFSDYQSRSEPRLHGFEPGSMDYVGFDRGMSHGVGRDVERGSERSVDRGMHFGLDRGRLEDRYGASPPSGLDRGTHELHARRPEFRGEFRDEFRDGALDRMREPLRSVDLRRERSTSSREERGEFGLGRDFTPPRPPLHPPPVRHRDPVSSSADLRRAEATLNHTNSASAPAPLGNIVSREPRPRVAVHCEGVPADVAGGLPVLCFCRACVLCAHTHQGLGWCIIGRDTKGIPGACDHSCPE